MKLWSKDNTETSALIEAFTVGNDRLFDTQLAQYDIQGSMAHATMLQQCGFLTADELAGITTELELLYGQAVAGRFEIEPGVEDVHSQVELLLTRKLGEAGKKIHTGRSRNDQVATDIKLFLRAEITAVKEGVKALFDVLQTLSEQHKNIQLPGYTHMQVGMPSSFGLWLGAYAESLVDDLELLAAAYAVANKNPLGSGAGYGSSFPLNRSLTTKLLQFGSLNYNSVYAQMTRGKTEKITAVGLSSVAATLNKLAADICLYVGQDMGFLSFPESITTGSSIMPHKKNPDVFELVRAKTGVIQAVPNTLAMMLNNMPSGYHRDLQLTKEILFPAIETLKSCLRVLAQVLPLMQPREGILNQDKYRYIFTVDAVNKLVQQGMSFRDAYKETGNQVNNGTFQFTAAEQLPHTHEGSIGNLCTAEIKGQMERVLKKFE